MLDLLSMCDFGSESASGHLGQKVKNQRNSDWEQASHAPAYNILDSGALRIALLFGSAAVAFTLILAPILDRGTGNLMARRSTPSGLDSMATGAVASARGYTLRRSVLQDSAAPVCIIDQNGKESGRC
jgi:hypothetical protein